MALDISYVNNYGYAIDSANLKTNIKLVLDNASQKTMNTPEAVIEQNVNSTNSALLFEYTQSIAKSNIAQQLVLDNNLKETLKFLNSEAAKKATDIIDEVLTENNVLDYESNEKTKEDSDMDNLELFDIKIDDSKVNIFAA